MSATYTISISWVELDNTIANHDGQPRELAYGTTKTYPTWAEANAGRNYYLTRWTRPTHAIDIVISEIQTHEHGNRELKRRAAA